MFQSEHFAKGIVGYYEETLVKHQHAFKERKRAYSFLFDSFLNTIYLWLNYAAAAVGCSIINGGIRKLF